MADAPSEVCGEGRGRASNPRMVGKQEEFEVLHRPVNEATERRNECAVRMWKRTVKASMHLN